MAHPSQSDADIPRVNLDSRRELAEPTEREAAEDLYAGALAIPDGAGGIIAQDTDGSRPGYLLVALDARQRGMEWGDDYPTGSLVSIIRPEGGYLNLPLAAGENVAVDVPLVPNGAGAVRESGTDADGNYNELGALVGYAQEAVDNSGGTEVTQVPVEVTF